MAANGGGYWRRQLRKTGTPTFTATAKSIAASGFDNFNGKAKTVAASVIDEFDGNDGYIFDEEMMKP